jgi:hypothetical protein
VDLLPGQEAVFGGIEPVALFTEEGAGVLVLAKSNGNTRFDLARNRNARIDGFTITGSDQGGGVILNGYANYVEVSNNVIKSNQGFFGGGVRLGHPQLTIDNESYTDAQNDNVRIHNNHITQNGGQGGAGGGVALCTGADNYQVTRNYVCGNFNLDHGGGIGHLGLSNNGLIAENEIVFNESFNQGLTVQGGGVFIAGHPALAVGGLSPGSGSVKVNANRILGNLAGAGDGGGIALLRTNGADVDSNRNNANNWYRIDLFNNIVANNVSALAGGGISLQDAVRVNAIHNTVARNDSTATAGNAFSPGNPNQSNPQPAGIVSRAHSTELNAALGRASNNPNQVPATLKTTFSNPRLVDSIVWENRSFYFVGNPNADPPVYQLQPAPDTPDFRDLGVLGAVGPLNPDYCVLTSLTGFDGVNYGDGTNRVGNPFLSGVVSAYFNGGRGLTVLPGEPGTGIIVPVAFDEGGNFIQNRFGPLTLQGTERSTLYHIQPAAPAYNTGQNLVAQFPDLGLDFDRQARPFGTGVDIGADEAR